MYKFSLFLLAVVFILVACDNSTTKSSNVTNENCYDIYSIILKDNFADYSKIALGNFTNYSDIFFDNEIFPFNDLTHALTNLQLETYNSFVEQNKTSDSLQNKFNLDKEILLIGKSVIDDMFKKTDFWDEYYTLYPNTQGFLTFSRIGYNNDSTQALVYYGNRQGDTTGAGFYVIFIKSDGKWTLDQKMMVWMS